MTAATRGRPRSGGHLTYAVRTPFVARLAWATVAFVSVALSPVSGDSSVPFVEELPSAAITSHSTEPTCWETQGPHESDCFHDEPLTAETYPLTQEMLERALTRYTTTDLSLHRAFHRARKRGVLKVVALGGSVTYGHGCESPAGLTGKHCAWPNRLQQWCEERIEDFKVEVLNAARPAYTILNLLHSLYLTLPVDMEVDLIIMDYGVNDAIIELFDYDMNNVKLAHEVFIRHVRNRMVDMPALLYAETFISPARVAVVPRQASNMAEVHAEVTTQYDIPMVSFRDAVWPDIEDSRFADQLWGTDVHPDWQVQQVLADVVVYYLQKSYARFLEAHGLLSDPSPQEQAVLLFDTTNVPVNADGSSFTLDADVFVGRPPPQELVESVGWSFSKDASGRGGLIGFGNSSTGAIVSFDLPCDGERQVLDIAYLKSYSGMGAVRVAVTGADTDPEGESDKDSNDDFVVIDGLWESQASVLDYAAVPIPNGLDPVRVTFEVLSAETEVSYSGLLSDVAGSEFNSIRLDRKFIIVHMQC